LPAASPAKVRRCNLDPFEETKSGLVAERNGTTVAATMIQSRMGRSCRVQTF
jgi:hypothetical protein